MLLYKLSAELATLVDGHATSQNTRKSGKETDICKNTRTPIYFHEMTSFYKPPEDLETKKFREAVRCERKNK